MKINGKISQAISLFREIGEDYHEAFLWHLLHGVVVVDPDGLLLAYYCQWNDLDNPVDREDADCLYVTYYGGSVKKMLHIFSDWIGDVAFCRMFKGSFVPYRYNSERMKKLFSKLER
jgi:hypothetical protein